VCEWVQFNIKVLDTEDEESKKEQEEQLRKPFHEDEEVDERIQEAISAIQEGLDAIQEQQRVDRNRLSLHSATNRSSHNGVVVDSIVETVVFIMSLLFQVTTAMPPCLPLHVCMCVKAVFICMCDVFTFWSVVVILFPLSFVIYYYLCCCVNVTNVVCCLLYAMQIFFVRRWFLTRPSNKGKMSNGQYAA
jgi:hypothetical protein